MNGEINVAKLLYNSDTFRSLMKNIFNQYKSRSTGSTDGYYVVFYMEDGNAFHKVVTYDEFKNGKLSIDESAHMNIIAVHDLYKKWEGSEVVPDEEGRYDVKVIRCPVADETTIKNLIMDVFNDCIRPYKCILDGYSEVGKIESIYEDIKRKLYDNYGLTVVDPTIKGSNKVKRFEVKF